MSDKLLKRMTTVGLAICFFIIIISSSMKAEETAEEYNDLGIECFKAGDYDCAQEYFTKAIELDPSLARAYINRAATVCERTVCPIWQAQWEQMEKEIGGDEQFQEDPFPINEEAEEAPNMMENQNDGGEQLQDEPIPVKEEAEEEASDMMNDCISFVTVSSGEDLYIGYYDNGEFQFYTQPDYYSFDLRPEEETRLWSDMMDKANMITSGMTTGQVVEIMGEPDDSFSRETKTWFTYSVKRHFVVLEMFCGIANRDSSVQIEFENDGVVYVHQNPNYRIAFDAEDWATASDWRRRAMIDDFIQNYHPEKMNKDELISILGTPRPCGMFESYDLVYDLGPMWVTLFPVDDDWFVVNFSEDGRVKEYGIISD